MVSNFIIIMELVFNACSDWLEQLFSASEVFPIYLGAVGIALMIRFILMPLFRGGVTAGSDKVSSRVGSNEVSNSSSSDEVTR